MPSSALDELRKPEYPQFSEAEMARRRRRLLEVAQERDLDRLLIHGGNWAGSAVQWLTGWPVSVEAMVVVDADERDLLLVQYFNHVPLASQLAPEADVRWGGRSTAESAAAELVRRGSGGQRVGFIGQLPYMAAKTVLDRGLELVNCNDAYTQLRLIKSEEELVWLRAGAELSDAGVMALERELRSGLTEWDLADIVQRAYVPRSGTTVIHFFGVTSMSEPTRSVPAQYPSTRQVRAGDAVTTEISAAFWGHAGQVLRTLAVESRPTALYQELHDVASAAYEAILAVLRPGATAADIVEAASVIEDAGYTTCDDLVHGFGGGYLPPVLSSSSREGGPVPDMTLRTGMTMVVQPNVITPDGAAGVQTGELVAITDDGVASLHEAPKGLRLVG